MIVDDIFIIFFGSHETSWLDRQLSVLIGMAEQEIKSRVCLPRLNVR